VEVVVLEVGLGLWYHRWQPVVVAAYLPTRERESERYG